MTATNVQASSMALRRWRILGVIPMLASLVFGAASPGARAYTESSPRTGDLNVPLDDFLASVAQGVPAFAGIARAADGKLDVWIVGGSPASGSRAYNALIRAHPASFSSPAGYRTIDAKFSFVDLYEWKELVTTQLLGGSDGVVLVAIAKKKNSLLIGLSDIAAQDSVREKVEALGIPWEAVVLEELGGPVRFESSCPWSVPPIYTHLRACHDPMVGGLQIEPYTNGQVPTGVPCTLGFTATRAGYDGFVTASHCGTANYLDGQGYAQPEDPPHSDAAGWEVMDRSGTQCSGMPTGICRWADAEFDRKLVARKILRGYIARTTPPPAYGWNGTNLWRIVGEIYPVEDNPVRMVGRTSGYTPGTIINECANVIADDGKVTLRCQAIATYPSAGGDSGGPIFAGTGVGHDVWFLGIHVGVHPSNSGWKVFSPISLIQLDAELGTLTNCAAGMGC